MARIWLHIGLHKTGTSAAQSWCAEHEEDLLRQRVLYIRVRDNLPACGALASELMRGSPEGEQLAYNVVDQINEHGNIIDDVIISSESFSHFGPESIAFLVQMLGGHEVAILVWLRRQDRFVEAIYKQTVKWGGHVGSIEDYAKRSPAYLDYDTMLEEWQAAFPDASIKPQIYVETTPGHAPDSVASLLTAIGRPDLIPLDSVEYRVNLSPKGPLIMHYNDIPQGSGKALRQANRQLMKEYGDQASGRGDLLSPDMAVTLMDRFTASNAEVLRKWFPDRAELFAADISVAEASSPEDESMLKRFDHLFAKKLKG